MQAHAQAFTGSGDKLTGHGNASSDSKTSDLPASKEQPVSEVVLQFAKAVAKEIAPDKVKGKPSIFRGVSDKVTPPISIKQFEVFAGEREFLRSLCELHGERENARLRRIMPTAIGNSRLPRSQRWLHIHLIQTAA